MNKIKKIIGSVIDAIIVIIIVFFISTLSVNLIKDKLYLFNKATPENVVKEERTLKFIEIISEKIYYAFVNEEVDNVNSMFDTFNKKNEVEIKEIAGKMKVGYEKVDAKAIEIHKLSDDIFNAKVIFKKDDDYSYDMTGKVNTFVIKLNRNNGTFKVLEMEVGG